MKCIKALKTTKDVEIGDIKRVDDKTANNMVGSMWAYVPKSEWKSFRGVKSKSETETEEPKKKSNPKQMDGQPTSEPFVKTRKKLK